MAVKKAAELPVVAVAAFENLSKKLFFLAAIVVNICYLNPKKAPMFCIGAFSIS
jgi:hypothetical protein